MRELACIVLLVLFTSCNSKSVIVACVGDSITAGARHKNQSKTAYPIIMNDLLGDGYSVVNLGRSGATALKKSNLSYWHCKEYSNVFAVKPNIITIKLGTNDSKPQNWNSEAFKENYQNMIDSFMNISPQPIIYLCLPVPVFEHSRFSIDGKVVQEEIIPIIKSLAKENDIQVIDLYQPFVGKGDLLPDGVHPEEEGAAIIAKVITKHIKN